ncbi:hypothetical protein M3221_08375 [Domibacillus indicus]|uniref:hypothetical protein n=1 Tax=Domibacillus indicus TaxID=1437523 RepID=UPI00203AD801|nr:hypothetical protein [Domibacillus indicus]MCM3788415.1 hypothetical protein [Domibacillus indicus]
MKLLRLLVSFVLAFLVSLPLSSIQGVEAAAVGKEAKKEFTAKYTIKNWQGSGWNRTLYKKVLITVNGYDVLSHKNSVDVIITVTDSWVTNTKGKESHTFKQNGNGSLILDVKQVKMSTSGKVVNKKMDRDYIYSQQWWGKFDQSGVAQVKAGFGVGYGPLSASVEPSKPYNIDPRSKQNLYLGGEKYPTATSFTFPKTSLSSVKQYYTTRAEIGVISTAKKTTSKSINVKVAIPVRVIDNHPFDSSKNKTYVGDTYTYDLTLPYKSGK